MKLMIEIPILVAGRFGSGLQSKPGTHFEKADGWVSPSPYEARNDDAFTGMITQSFQCVSHVQDRKRCFVFAVLVWGRVLVRTDTSITSNFCCFIT